MATVGDLGLGGPDVFEVDGLAFSSLPRGSVAKSWSMRPAMA
jgi:hypothetical protein